MKAAPTAASGSAAKVGGQDRRENDVGQARNTRGAAAAQQNLIGDASVAAGMRPPGSPEERHPGLDAKIVAALDRIGDALQVLARRAAETHDLSPTQLRVLTRLSAGPPPIAQASELAREFGIANPTVSDALAALGRKGMIEQEQDSRDRRRRHLRLTNTGRAVGQSVSRWTAPAEVASSGIERPEAEQLLETLLDLLDRMRSAGLLTVVRACTTCQHFEPGPRATRPVVHHCRFFGYHLRPSDLRVDCAEHVARENSTRRDPPAG